MALLLAMSPKAPGRNVPEPTKGTSLSSQFLIHLADDFPRNLHLLSIAILSTSQSSTPELQVVALNALQPVIR